MAPQNHFIAFLTIFLSVYLLSPSPSMVAASPALEKKVCNGDSILNRDFCLKTLSNPQAAAAKNLNQLADAVMKLAASNAQTTLNVITGMTKKPSSPGCLQALKTCEDVYRYAIRSFGMISAELSEDAMSANYDVSVIGPEADRCVNALAAAKVQAPQVSDGNKFLQYYSSLGSQITSFVN
ncbi:uncharacterized protein LOC110417138 [Herrania umbratica]|uniref:Uncharacterized protein LOC110417138 n=1 Tax=Herrania umbratica TaxID=108875 RepID=A0A6J1ADN6_9ROSI|nr:uncharacterized protein LOC110417138 [Herrania umbratica]